MSKITNDGLTRSGTGCFISYRQQWASTVGVNSGRWRVKDRVRLQSRQRSEPSIFYNDMIFERCVRQISINLVKFRIRYVITFTENWTPSPSNTTVTVNTESEHVVLALIHAFALTETNMNALRTRRPWGAARLSSRLMNVTDHGTHTAT